MKKAIIFILSVLFPEFISGQFISPGCSDLKVENIQMDDDTAGLMKITISNSCINCASGLNGCVYEELRVIRNVFPFDTVASSDCLCLSSPENGSQKVYSVIATVTAVPPLSEIRVSLMNCECDNIPFSSSLGVAAMESDNSLSVYPNLFDGKLYIQNNTSRIIQFTLFNSSGEKIIENILTEKTCVVNLSASSKGVYYYKLTSDKNLFRTGKIIKQ